LRACTTLSPRATTRRRAAPRHATKSDPVSPPPPQRTLVVLLPNVRRYEHGRTPQLLLELQGHLLRGDAWQGVATCNARVAGGCSGGAAGRPSALRRPRWRRCRVPGSPMVRGGRDAAASTRGVDPSLLPFPPPSSQPPRYVQVVPAPAAASPQLPSPHLLVHDVHVGGGAADVDHLKLIRNALLLPSHGTHTHGGGGRKKASVDARRAAWRGSAGPGVLDFRSCRRSHPAAPRVCGVQRTHSTACRRHPSVGHASIGVKTKDNNISRSQYTSYALANPSQAPPPWPGRRVRPGPTQIPRRTPRAAGAQAARWTR
jgi:hypothetical protein